MAEEQDNYKINFDTNAKQAANDTNKLGDAIDSTTNSVENNEQAYKSLKTQLREANQELVKSIQIYGETSAQAVKAAKGVADLKDQIGFAKDLSDNFNPDQKFKALGAATQIAATSMQGVTAGMALFGDQSQDTEKMLLKVQAAMAFSDAISGLSNLGDQWKNLKAVITSTSAAQKVSTTGTVLAAGAQKLFTGSVNMTSTGFKFLRGAIIATGIGALVVGIGLLIANFDKVKKVMFNLIPGLEGIGDSIMNIVNTVTDFLGVTSEAERLVDRQKAMAEKSLSQNEKYLKRHESTLTDSQKREIELRNAHFERVKEGEFSNAESIQIYKEAKAKDARLKQEEENKKLQEIQDKANEEAKKKREQAQKDKEQKAKEAEEKRKVLIKEGLDYEANLRKEIEDEADDTDEKKLERQRTRAEQEIELLKQKGIDVVEITRLNAEKFDELERELAEKRDEEDLDRQAQKGLAEIEIASANADKQIEVDRKVAQAKKEVLQAGVSDVENIGKQLQTLAGKNKALQRTGLIIEGAVGLAKIVSNTMQAVTKTQASFPGPVGLALSAVNVASGALSAAAQIKAVATGLKAVGGGDAGTSPNISASAGGGTPSAPPTVAFNNSAENQIGSSVARIGSENPPIKVVVAESDITKAQNNVNVLVEKNTF